MSAFSSSRPAGLIRPAVLLAVVLLGFPATAPRAQEGGQADAQRKEEAGAHLKRGAQLIDAEDLTGALAEFEAAYRLVPSPTILHNFGIVYQGLGRKAAALDAFERFLKEAVKAPPDTREHARKAVQTLRPEVAELKVQADLAGAAIFVDGREVGRTPQEKAIYLEPGPHQVSVEKTDTGAAHTERIDVAAGQQRAVVVRLVRPAPAAPAAAEVARSSAAPAESGRGWHRRAARATLIGAGVAAAVSGGFLLWRYVEFSGFNDDRCGTEEIDIHPRRAACRERLTRGRNATTGAKVSAVAAAALGVGAGVLFLTLPAESGGHAVSLRASPSSLGLGLQGRF